MKCNAEARSFIHCIWTCKLIDGYWENLENRLCLILDIKLNKYPKCLLFGLPDTQFRSKHSNILFCICTFCARKNILLKWIDYKPQTIGG